MSLVGGAPLIIEDLSVTMKLVTFTAAQYSTRKEVNRLIRRLVERGMAYSLREARNPWGNGTSIWIRVGTRDLNFWI